MKKSRNITSEIIYEFRIPLDIKTCLTFSHSNIPNTWEEEGGGDMKNIKD